MTTNKTGENPDFSHLELSEVDPAEPVREILGWTEEEMKHLLSSGTCSKTYFPAELGQDIKVGDLYTIQSVGGNSTTTRITSIERTSEEGTEGLKITFKTQGG